MLLRRRKKKSANEPKFPGINAALSGYQAVVYAESLAADAASILGDPGRSSWADTLAALVRQGFLAAHSTGPVIRELHDIHSTLGVAVGHALAGLRSAVMGDGGSLLEAHDSLTAAAGKRLTLVLNIASRPARRQAGSPLGGHDDLVTLANTGAFLLMPSRAQELVDFPLIAHRIAELALTPGICARDIETDLAVEPLKLPERELVEQFLGRSDEMIDIPTRAQALLFGENRRRVPQLFDLDRPLGIGGSQDRDSFFRAIASQRPYFNDTIAPLADLVFKEFAGFTGRKYASVSGYRHEDAELLVVARGAVVPPLEAVVDYLREKRRVKAGLINLTMCRPFPGAELSKMLVGRRAVCVLERSDQPLAEDPPLTREVRAALDKALENGAGDDPYPGYASIRKLSERPRVSSGIYGIGCDLPSVSDLIAVFDSIAKRGAPREFYLAVQPTTSHRNYPTLEATERTLRQAEFTLEERLLKGGGAQPPELATHRGYQFHTPAGLGGEFVGELLHLALNDGLSWRLKSIPDGNLAVGNRNSVFTLVQAQDVLDLRSAPMHHELLLVRGLDFYRSPERLKSLKSGGILVIQSEWEPAELWPRLARRVRDWIRRNQLEVWRIDALAIAREHTSDPYYVDQVALFALAGAFLKLCPEVSSNEIHRVIELLKKLVTERLGETHVLPRQIAATLEASLTRLEAIDVAALESPGQPLSPEPKVPWSVREVERFDRTLFDLGRFWDSVGYFFETGQSAETLSDPFVATGVIPARSAVFRDQSVQRSRLPRLIPEACTGCGVCWTVCPDTALPPTLQSVDELISTGIDICNQQGHSMIQLNRVSEGLSKLSYRVVQKDDLGQHRTLDSVLRTGYEQLMEKLGLDQEKRAAFDEEFVILEKAVGSFPLVKTERFFTAPHKAAKGSGRLLSIAVNPSTCKSCLLCVQECPESALESATQTAARVDENRFNVDFLLKLPERSVAEVEQSCVSDGDPDSLMQLMLNRQTYHTLVGGDGAFAGHGPKIATHLVTAMAEALMRPRVDQQVQKLDQLTAELELHLQGEINKQVHINDFDEFSRRLKQITKKGLQLDSLIGTLRESDTAGVDTAQLQHQGWLMAELKSMRDLIASGPSGGGRARMGLTLNLGRSLLWSGSYPYNPHTAPWVGHLADDAPAVAEGLYDGIVKQLVGDCRTVRLAELECDSSLDADAHRKLIDQLSWESLRPAERDLLPPLLVFDHGGSSSMQMIARLLAGPVPLKIVVIEPLALHLPASGLSDAPTRIEPALLALGAGNAFVLQSTVAHPGHLLSGLREGLRQNRPALFHIYAPDPQQSGIGPRQVAELARLAVDSRVFPLFRYDPEAGDSLNDRLDLAGNPAPELDWLRTDVNLGHRPMKKSVNPAEWAFAQTRFHEHFDQLGKGRWTDRMCSLAHYFDSDEARRQDLQPVLDLIFDGRLTRLALSPAMIGLTADRLSRWRLLRNMTTPQTRPVQQPAVSAPVAVAATPAISPPNGDSMEKLTRNLMRLSGLGSDSELFGQTLRDFIKQRRSEAEKG